MRVEVVGPEEAGAVEGLADVLVDCVDGGASVGFLAPLAREDALRWWRQTLPQPGTTTWAARDDDGTIVGCVRLMFAPLPNSGHRAEVAKLLVHRRARGRGVASRLLAAAEAEARRRGRTILILDTHTGSPAEALYLRQGWIRVGTVPDYAATPAGELAPTTILYKRLQPGDGDR